MSTNQKWTRSDIRFPSGDEICAGWLYLPNESAAVKRPAVILGHGLGAIKEMGLDSYASAFADAGYIVVVFDYRHFGESSGEPRQLLDIKRQLDDWKAAIAFTRSLDSVDPDQVILFGSSFGGGHVIVAAAKDPRIAAAISQCPFTSGFASTLTLGLMGFAKVSAFVTADIVTRILGLKPVMIPLAGPPGSGALMNAPDALSGYRALIPTDQPFEDYVIARVGLSITNHFPGRYAKKVRCPILFCVCDKDSVAPAGATLKYAEQSPQGEIIRYPFGHFDIYVGEGFKQTIADQLAFLQKHVPVSLPADMDHASASKCA